MLSINTNNETNVFLVEPENEISIEDIEYFTSTVNQYINKQDKVPNLVFHSVSLPHWKTIQSFRNHLRFIRDHQRLVQKVAVVSDSPFLAALPTIADHFLGAKVRHFRDEAFSDAITWAETDDNQPGLFEEITDMPADVVAIRAKGTITALDYRGYLMPLVNEKLETHDKLKMLFVLGEEFDGCSAGAVWDDTRFGLLHCTSFSKLALVSDIEWIRHSAKLFGFLMPTQIMVFDLAELEEAKHWIRT